MDTHRALPLVLVTAALGCEAGVGVASTVTPPSSEAAALCGAGRPESTVPEPTSSDDGSGASRWFVVRSLNLGFDDFRSGKRTPDAWRCYGFNLDGHATSAEQSRAGLGSCQRVYGSKTDTLLDGASGIDNNFGRFTLPLLHALDPCLDDPANQEAAFQILLRIDGDPTKDASSVAGALFIGRSSGAVRDASRIVPVEPLKPIAVFPSAYVANGFWVSGDAPGARIDLPLTVASQVLPMEHSVTDYNSCPARAELRLPITKPILAIKMDGGSGMLGGVMPVASLRSSLSAWLGQSGLCPEASFSQLVLNSVTEEADLALAPDADPTTTTCDAISIGIGFTVSPVAGPPAGAPLGDLPQTICGSQ